MLYGSPLGLLFGHGLWGLVDRLSGPYILVMVYGEIEGVLSAGVHVRAPRFSRER